MKEYDITVDFEIKVAKSGKISESIMKKVLNFLHKSKKVGVYFLTDTKGFCTCWDYDNDRENVKVSCEITSDEIDHYNSYVVPKYNGKLDYEFAEYESYKVN
jgi:hypothetical protein